MDRTSDGSMLPSENRLGVPLYRLSNEATKSPSNLSESGMKKFHNENATFVLVII